MECFSYIYTYVLCKGSQHGRYILCGLQSKQETENTASSPQHLDKALKTLCLPAASAFTLPIQCPDSAPPLAPCARTSCSFQHFILPPGPYQFLLPLTL